MTELWNNLALITQAALIGVALTLVSLLASAAAVMIWPDMATDAVIGVGLVCFFVMATVFSIWEVWG